MTPKYVEIENDEKVVYYFAEDIQSWVFFKLNEVWENKIEFYENEKCLLKNHPTLSFTKNEKCKVIFE